MNFNDLIHCYYLYFIKNKDVAITTHKQTITSVKTQLQKQVAEPHLNNTEECVNKAGDEYLAAKDLHDHIIAGESHK